MSEATTAPDEVDLEEEDDDLDEPDESVDAPSEESEQADEADESQASADAGSDDEGSADAQAETPADAPAIPIVKTPEPEAQPFGFRVNGRDVSVPGAEVRGDTITIPVETFRRQVQRYLQDPDAIVQRERQYQTRLAELDPEKNSDVIRARRVWEMFTNLLENTPDDQALEEFYKLKQDWPVTKANAEAKAARAELEAFRNRGAQQEQQERRAAEEPEIKGGLRKAIESVATQFPDADFDLDELEDYFWEGGRSRVLFRAEKDMPEYGLRAGDIGVRFDAIGKHLSFTRNAQLRALANVQTASSVKARNDAATGKTQGRRPPPAVSTKGSPTLGDVSIPDPKKDKDGFKKAFYDKYGLEP